MSGAQAAPDLAGALIAGGRSARMGADKRALALREGGPTLAAIALRLLADVAAEVLVVACDPGPFAAMGARIVPDPAGLEGQGPLAGIAAALAAARAERVLCVAADMPGVAPDLLRLLAAIDARESTWDAVLPASSSGWIEPLCALYRRSALPAVSAALARGERSPARLLRDPASGLRVRVVAPSEWAASDPRGRSFRDIDTPADLLAAQGESREADANGIIVPGNPAWPS